MQSTSIHSEHRTCPRHGQAMELILDDSRSGVSPIYWRCDKCRGKWAEEFFYFRAEKALPIRAMIQSFSFQCPVCGSLDVQHECVVGCCDSHGCNACGAGFDLTVELVEQHGPPASREELHTALDREMCIAVGGGSPYIEHPLTLSSRHCERHPDIALKFSHFDGISDERHRFGWSCSECKMFYFDYAFKRTQRPIFIPSSHPEVSCPACGSIYFDSQPDLAHASCISCGSIVILRAKLIKKGL